MARMTIEEKQKDRARKIEALAKTKTKAEILKEWMLKRRTIYRDTLLELRTPEEKIGDMLTTDARSVQFLLDWKRQEDPIRAACEEETNTKESLKARAAMVDLVYVHAEIRAVI